MESFTKSLECAADGVLVVDKHLKVVYRNQPARELLGLENKPILGLPCYQVVQGFDGSGTRICGSCCAIAKRALKGMPVSNYDIRVRDGNEPIRWLNTSILTYTHNGEDGERYIVHLFRDVTRQKENERFLKKVLEVAQQYHHTALEPSVEIENTADIDTLTRREREVLSLLAQGNDTSEIAENLSISTNTVRNHVQHILQKLHFHSRIEVVAFAIKQGLEHNGRGLSPKRTVNEPSSGKEMLHLHYTN